MTLVISACGTDFVILGTDSRSTTTELGGSRMEINTINKLIPLSKHVAIMIYGAGNRATYLVERFLAERASNVEKVTQLADDFSAFCRRQARLSSDVPRNRNQLTYYGFVIAGLDKRRRRFEPHIYGCNNYDAFDLESYSNPQFALEGKPMIARYLFRTYYNESLTFEKMRKLVAVALNETRKIDGDVGGPINMATIDSDGFRPIQNIDVRDYIRQWENDSDENKLVRNKEVSDGILDDDESVV
jgi:20S proteasome alpha/beta subunit